MFPKPDIDELWQRFSTLGAESKRALEVMAVAHGKLSKRDTLLAIKAATVRDGHLRPTQVEVGATLARVARVGLLEGRQWAPIEALAERIRRRLIADGRFDARAATVSKVDPVAWDRWRRTTPTALTRELRCAFVAGDLERFDVLLRRFDDLYGVTAPDVSRWVSQPLEAALLERLPLALVAPVLEHLSAREFDALAPEPGLLELVARLAARHPADPTLQRLAARGALLSSRLAEIPKAVRASKDPRDRMLTGLLLLMRGDLAASTKAYASGLAGLRKLSPAGVGVRLAGPDGLLLPLAYALHGGKTRLKQLQTICKRGLEASVGERGAQAGIYEQYARLAELVGGGVPPAGQHPKHPLAALIDGLVDYWSERPLDAARMDEAIAQAEALNQTWLAGELSALRDDDPGRCIPHTTWLGSHRRAKPAWERQLEALEAAVDSAGGPRGPAEVPKARVAWLVRSTADWIDLEARTQVYKARSGWSSGRPVAMKRVATQASAIKGMTERDLRIAAVLRTRQHTGWGGYAEVEYDWPLAATWEALVGHPAVFLAEDSSQRLEVAARRPRVVVEQKRKQWALSIVPPPPPEGVEVTWVSPGRIEIVRFDKTQTRLAGIVGRGLLVPRTAKARLGALVAALAAAFDVEDVAAAADAEDVVTDGRIRVQLRPVGAGLRVRAVTRPLGDDGPAFYPGLGAPVVVAHVGDRACRATRDLRDEAHRLTAAVAGAPMLGGVEVEAAGLELTDRLQCLELLLELQDVDNVLVEWPEGGTLRLLPRVSGQSLSVSVKSIGDWFAASGSLRVDEELTLKLADLVERARVAGGRFVRLDDGRFLALTERLRRQLDGLGRVSQRHKSALHVHPLAAGVLEPLLEDAGRHRTDSGWRAHRARLGGQPPMIEPPTTLEAELRPYQRDGFAWAARLAACGVGACLADDMGLGKTVQALALLLQRAAEGPALVIAPTSVCGTWEREAWRFAPSLRVHRFGAKDRDELLAGLGPADVLVCSYGLLQSEAEALAARTWATLILDEAQAIKNHTTRRHKAVRALTATARLALTGTPIENHLGELWSLFSVLNDGLLGRLDGFLRQWARPVEAGDRAVSAQLRLLVLPFILRRTKSAVLQDLPSRTDIVVPVTLGEEEAALYEALRRQAIDELEAAEGGGGAIEVLAQLTRLRLACCNPRLVLEGDAPPSSKLAAFGAIVEGLRANRHRALVFSQFVRHLALIREWLDARGVPYLYLDGSTPGRERDRLVDAFQAGEGDLFLISLRAGGTGLNLTGADYVVHMDPWWNPAVEDQASDRAHRIGQTRPVTVYRLVAEGTIEEQIVELHHKKRDLADRLLSGADAAARLSTAELMELLRGAG